MTPGGSAGTAAAGHRVEPAPTSELHEQIRQCLDDEVLMATGRSVGDIASGHVADALLSGPLAPLLNLVDFACWIVSLDDDDPDSPGRIARRTVTLNEIVTRARRALDAS